MAQNREIGELGQFLTVNTGANSISVNGSLSTLDLSVTGNLTVTGTTFTVNTTNLEVSDKNIVIAKGAGSAAASNGAGITVDSGYANLYYSSSANAWTSDVGFNILNGNVVINATSDQIGLFIDGTVGSNTSSVKIQTDSNGFGRMEFGGSSGAYLDFKTPDSDDYDLRLIVGPTYNRITTIGDLQLAPTSNGGTIITSSSNTVAALRITQTGSANAFVVEDSANPDSTPFVINADGLVGINAATGPNVQLNIGGIGPSSSNTTYSVYLSQTIPSASTTVGSGFTTSLSTQAAAFTCSSISHFNAVQGTIGAGSSVTNQYGFYADASLTGATNDYGFYSAIASGTGRWNFYAGGTADNYFAGNVGIGTTSPGAKLTVAGGNIRLSDVQQIEWGGSTNSIEGSNASNYLRFWTNNTLRMTLDNAGNLGLGVTPSAWSVFKAMEFGAGAFASISTSEIDILQNAVYLSGTNWTYKATAAATMYRQGSGAHSWWNSASGSAGNSITFTQAMTLSANGALGIGVGATGAGSTYGEKLLIAGAGGTQASMMFWNAGQGSGQIGVPASGSNLKIYNTYSTGTLTGGVGIDIDQNGNVGIGTTAPTVTLEANGASKFTGTVFPSQNSYSGASYIVVNTPTFTLINPSYNHANGSYSNFWTVSSQPEIYSTNSTPYGVFAIGGYPKGYAISNSYYIGLVGGDFRSYRGNTQDVGANTQNSLSGVLSFVGHLTTANASIVTGTSRQFNSTTQVTIGTINTSYGLQTGLIQGTLANFTANVGTHYCIFTSGTVGATSGTGTALLTNYYDAYFAGLTVQATGTVTNKYGVYQAATDHINYFGGNVLIGTTSTAVITGYSAARLTSYGSADGATFVSGAGNNTLNLGKLGTPAGTWLAFVATSGTGYGNITVNGGGVAYNTSSDYRLKENIQPINNGLATINQLKPVSYDWKNDKRSGEGFLAHELQQHIPLAVTGTKDAVKEDGSIDPQGVDYSKIVVHLVSAIQELNTKLEAALNRIEELENK